MENAFETKPVLELGQSKTEQRRQLVDATLRGTKTATASLRTEYQPFTEEPMPNVGEQVVLLG